MTHLKIAEGAFWMAGWITGGFLIEPMRQAREGRRWRTFFAYVALGTLILKLTELLVALAP